MGPAWHIASVQPVGEAVITVVTADLEEGHVLLGTAGRSLSHFSVAGARKLAEALTEAAERVDPGGRADESADLVEALRAFIVAERDR